MNKKFKIVLNSPVVLGFVMISFAVLLVDFISGGWCTQMLFTTYHSSLASPMTYVRFFTHVLGHVSWEHFLGNMMYLLLLGPMLEEKYGSRRLIWVIVITAFVTGLINYLFFWNVALCGASGVCFAFILLSSFTGFREREIPLTFILVAAIFLGQQVYQGIVVDDNVSNMAHIVGGVVGSVVGFVMNRR